MGIAQDGSPALALLSRLCSLVLSPRPLLSDIPLVTLALVLLPHGADSPEPPLALDRSLAANPCDAQTSSWSATCIMEHHSHPSREPLRLAPSGHPLRHIASNVSAISDAEYTPYDAPASHPQQLRGRESIVSIESHHSHHAASERDRGNGHSYAPGPPVWPGPFSYSGATGYAPVSAPAEQTPARTLSRASRKSSYAASLRHTAIPPSIQEEEYDLSLLRSAAPMGAAPRYDAIPEDEPAAVAVFDITSALGPMDSHDVEFIKKLQEQEAKGTLTGGLGQGFGRDSRVRVRHADLLSSPTTVQRSLTRSFTRRRSVKPMGRAETIREVGQDEANRRGEVIEVILEDPVAGADISNMEGSNMLYDSESRRSTFAVKEQVTRVFYPQPNWKPFSMRWPYLTMLVLLSMALAAMQEILYRRYSQDPILMFTSPEDVDPGFYFVVKFAPTLAAVVYGVLWQFVDFEVRRLEAYYQLSKEGGALAAESINVDYVTSFNFLRPFRALRLGHYAVALSSVATTFAVSLVPTFAAASVVLTPSRQERMDNPNAEKFLHFSATWSRLLTTTLLVCAVLGCVLFCLLQSRRSGLLADVRGIAGLASMAVASHILMDFKDMDTAKHKDIHHKLKHNRYMLRNSSLAPDDENPVSTQERDRYQDTHLSENPHPLMLRPAGWVPFILGLLAFTGFIPAFLFTPADVVTDKAPWVITALAVCLKLSWNATETAVRMMEPFYILSRRHAPARTLMLDYTALPFGYLPLRALFNGHLLVFAVGFGSVMAEFLTILVTGLATVDGQVFLREGKLGDKDRDGHRLINSGQETVASFYVSFGASVFILLYMSVTACVVFFRRRHPFLPRQPNTIASVLAFIHQSKMLYDFVGTAKYSSAEMARKLEDGKTYGLGWFPGRDGQTHCGVDQEELTSNYKHGVDNSQQNEPWNMQWDVL
ncbi:hypothetical protein TPAR_00760 [Tolypocladium paradoxum]|uniref:Spray n=1 Tax=Tolypocladium paradoxum TaxID=94208 RepID=A0A2S4L9E5_9HYPO|nr:hypothetical protein TPAR_00760 [Tolypocladium paradoxum]